MTELLGLLGQIGTASVALLWAPLGAWTLVWVLAEAGLHAGRSAHPALRYRTAQAVLLALPLGLGLAAGIGLAGLAPSVTPPPLPLPAPPDVVSEALVYAPPASAGVPLAALLMAFLGAAVCLWAVVALARLVRLGGHALTLRRLRRALPVAALPSLDEDVRLAAAQVGLRRPVRVDAPVVPMTFGLWRPLVVVPASMERDGLRLALGHEFVHVRQRDALAQWAEAVVGAVFALHPAVPRLLRRCDLLREMACDAEVLADASVSRRRYAALVSTFVTPPAPTFPATVGMADAPPHVYQRLLAMKSHPSPTAAASTRASWLLAAAVLASGTLAVTATGALAQPAPAVSVRALEKPLVVVDGEVSSAPLSALAPDAIFSVEVLKGHAAQARYGSAAADGVVSITTRAAAEAQGLSLDPARMQEIRVIVRGAEGQGLTPDSTRRQGVRIVHLEPGDKEGLLPLRFDSQAGEVRIPGEVRVRVLEAFQDRLRESLEAGELRAAVRGRVGETLSQSVRDAIVAIGSAHSADVTIRGSGTGVSPLFIVDGQPSVGSADVRGLGDIVSIEVLKREAAVARFGEAGANGVVMITTRAGATSGAGATYEALPTPALTEGVAEFAVRPAFPNPASGAVSVLVDLPAEAEVTLDVFDVRGRKVRGVEATRLPAGAGQALRVDTAGLAAGTYTYRLEARAAARTHASTGTFTVVR